MRAGKQAPAVGSSLTEAIRGYPDAPFDSRCAFFAFGWRSDSTYVGSQDGVTPLNYLRNPYPDGFVPVVGSSQGLLTGIGSSIATSIIGDSVTPYVENWSFNIQRLLPSALLIEAGYVGSHGV